MKEYDVVIAGAGPAGGQCARDLSRASKKVLLIDKAKDFSVNNYSSAGAPMELLDMFHLPESVVATYWNRINMHSDNNEHTWTAPESMGVIMEFKRLREFLADESQKHGCELHMGLAYHHHEQKNGDTIVCLKNHDKELVACKTKVLVDATGSEREVLAKDYDKKNALVATGIEYLIETTDEIYKTWSHALSVFMGLDWMPQGYAWIFPMEKNNLKVGVGRYFQHDRFVPHESSYKYYLDRLIEKCLKTKDPNVLDRHGKTLVYTYGRNDKHYDKNILAIGDAVSMVNPFAFEGIRHAMVSGRAAAKNVIDYLDGKASDFKPFKKEMEAYCGLKWRACEFMMKRIYREPDPRNIDLMLDIFKSFNINEMYDLAFHYDFRVGSLFYLKFLLLKTQNKIRSLFSRGS